MWSDRCEDGRLAEPGEYLALNFLKGDFMYRRWMEKEEGEGDMHPSLFKGISLLTDLIGQNLVT